MVVVSAGEKIKILLLENIHPIAKQRLESQGFHVELENHALKGEDLTKRAEGFHAIGIRSKTNIVQDFLDDMPELLTIGAFCIGTNQIDLDGTNSKGVPVFNAPYANTRSVAEMVIAQMISLARQLGDRNMLAHKGEWHKSVSGAREVRGKILGIVGYGHIGTQVSILAEALGLKVIFYDIIKKLPLGNAQPVDTLEDLLKLSDFVTFHVPETPLTKNMFRSEQIKLMKDGAFVINASRGTVIDIPALASALESGKLGGAAIDVFPSEPASNKEAFKSELQNMKNVMLSPHIGGSTEEAQEAIGLEVAESFIRFFKTGSTAGAVGFPNLDVPDVGEAQRILNVHKNVPGVLGHINGIISEAGANIRGQYLSTDSNIGYLVMDIDTLDLKDVVQKIDKLPTSIKTRIIQH